MFPGFQIIKYDILLKILKNNVISPFMLYSNAIKLKIVIIHETKTGSKNNQLSKKSPNQLFICWKFCIPLLS